MKRALAGILTVALMGLLLWSGMRPERQAPGTDPGPSREEPEDPHAGAEERLRGLLERARAGDVPGYLGSFSGELRQRLEREVAEKGRGTFSEELRRAAGARKSHAVFAPEPDGPDAARIVVESVYPDRNESQAYRLERGPDGWRVAEVETVRGHAPKARFGTPATYQEPEGVPVQGAPPPAVQNEEGTPNDPTPGPGS
jgi:hypothetical protein